MLRLNLQRLMKDKGIERSNVFLVKQGFTSYTASRLMTNKITNISIHHIEKLCGAFNCTIDDLFSWAPSVDMQNADRHPLQKLKRKESNIHIGNKLRELSPQKLEEVKQFLEGL